MAREESSGEGLIKMLLESSHMEPRGHFRGHTTSHQQGVTHSSSGNQFNTPGFISSTPRGLVTGPSGNNQFDSRHHSAASQHHQLIASLEERLVSLVQLDHSYAKSWRSDANALPTKSILLASSKETAPFLTDDEDYVNVDDEPMKPVPQYDPQYARRMMTECEKFVSFANPEFEDESVHSFEETIPKDGWTHQQKILYTRMIRILHQDRLARLANEGRDNEPILRRISVDKSAKRARLILSSYPTLWDVKVVQWLHTVFTEYLPKSYLAAWLDILQTLRSKVPKLVNKVLAPFLQHSSDDRMQQILADGLALLLRRPWDPAAKSISKSKLEQLPGNPVIIVAPPGPGDTQLMPKRIRLWNNQLGCLGKVIVINIPIPKGETGLRITINQYLQQMVTSTLTKVRETKSSHVDRPIILMGWGPGASIVTHVASIEKIAGLVCLGFPSTTLSGKRGEIGDPLLELKTPTLFVIGDRATDACSDDIEDFRERISVETGLIVVGSADSNLRISKRKKRIEGITQTMVDRNLMEEIRAFLVGILTNKGSSKTGHQVKIGVSGAGDTGSAGSSPRKLNMEPGQQRKMATGDFSFSPRKLEGGMQQFNSTVIPKKITKGRKRNSSSVGSEGFTAQLSPNKRASTGATSNIQSVSIKPTKQTNPRPKKPRKPKKVAGALPVDNSGSAPGLAEVPGTPAMHSSQAFGNNTGISLNARTPLPAAMLAGNKGTAMLAGNKGTAIKMDSDNVLPGMQQKSGVSQGFGGTHFPPGLLSISSPLPQSTLMGQGSSAPPPPQIRLPISPDTTFKPNVSGLFDQPLSITPSSTAQPVSGPRYPSLPTTMAVAKNNIRMVVPSSSPKVLQQQTFVRSSTPGNTGPRQFIAGPVNAGGPRYTTRPLLSTISITLPLPINQLQQTNSQVIQTTSASTGQVFRPQMVTGGVRAQAGHGRGRGQARLTTANRAPRFQSTGRPPVSFAHYSIPRAGFKPGANVPSTISNITSSSVGGPILPPGRFTSPVPTSQLEQTRLSSSFQQQIPSNTLSSLTSRSFTPAPSVTGSSTLSAPQRSLPVSQTSQQVNKNITGHPTVANQGLHQFRTAPTNYLPPPVSRVTSKQPLNHTHISSTAGGMPVTVQSKHSNLEVPNVVGAQPGIVNVPLAKPGQSKVAPPSVIQHSSMPVIQPSIVSAIQSSTVQPSKVPGTSKVAATVPSVIHHTTMPVKQSSITSAVQPSLVPVSAVQSSRVQPSAVQSSTVQPRRVSGTQQEVAKDDASEIQDVAQILASLSGSK